ncbi:MAG: molybdopterin-dependent oxidoreductase [Spirochaetales bacterium]|nr:molybdopterin-dependent oxidoreductase [Spirochaetales bacterium]
MSLPEDVPGITAVEHLFRYDIFGLPAELGRWSRDNSLFRLKVDGCVEREGAFSLLELRNDFEPVETESVLQCMTRVHWGRVLLRGARLYEVLQACGIRPQVRKIAFHGAEGFSTDLFLREVVEEPERFLLVYEMNGEPLTGEHGFPLRIAAIGKYAYKWCKWLVRISLLDYDFKGHYEGKRGWSDAATRGERVV